MIARTMLSVFAGTLVCGGAAPRADAGDFRVSFQYRSHSPRYYSSSVYSACAPRDDVYYDDYGAYAAPVLYDARYPTTYRRTYTRSHYYTRPVYRTHRTIHHRSGYRTHDYRRPAIHRRHYSKPRASIHIHKRPSGHHYRYDRPHSRYGSSRYRHHRSPARIRIHRR